MERLPLICDLDVEAVNRRGPPDYPLAEEVAGVNREPEHPSGRSGSQNNQLSCRRQDPGKSQRRVGSSGATSAIPHQEYGPQAVRPIADGQPPFSLACSAHVSMSLAEFHQAACPSRKPRFTPPRCRVFGTRRVWSLSIYLLVCQFTKHSQVSGYSG